jgi:hypothetical protein
LIEYLWEQDYRLWWHTPSLFNPGNFFGVQENIYPNLVSCNLLCLPKEYQMPVADLKEVTDASWHPFLPQAPESDFFLEDSDA